jgi:hypothetical protein
VLELVRAGKDPEASAYSYRDRQTFLEEFFPGHADEVIAGVSALLAR